MIGVKVAFLEVVSASGVVALLLSVKDLETRPVRRVVCEAGAFLIQALRRSRAGLRADRGSGCRLRALWPLRTGFGQGL